MMWWLTGKFSRQSKLNFAESRQQYCLLLFFLVIVQDWKFVKYIYRCAFCLSLWKQKREIGSECLHSDYVETHNHLLLIIRTSSSLQGIQKDLVPTGLSSCFTVSFEELLVLTLSHAVITYNGHCKASKYMPGKISTHNLEGWAFVIQYRIYYIIITELLSCLAMALAFAGKV